MTRLLIDGNSLLNQALLRGIDRDDGFRVKDEEGKEHQVNSAQYGIDGFFEKFAQLMTDFADEGITPRKCIVVWDGRNAKAHRRAWLANYKAGRDKIPEVNEQLNAARETCDRMLRDLGCHTAVQDGLEADDVLAYLAQRLRLERNIICTVDGDLSRLHDENTDIWRLGEMNVNPCGPFPHKYITLYKALVGDTSDKIPGATKFGEAAWIELVAKFGLEGLDALEELILDGRLDRLREDLEDFPKLRLIMEQKDQVSASYACARLYPELVNTMRKPMTLNAGMVKQWNEMPDELRVHALQKFYGTKTLVTAKNYAQVFNRLQSSLNSGEYVALDIETSTSEESDEWIEMRKHISEAGDKLDVLGSVLAGMGLTFGDNGQHTIYMSVDHADTENISVDQCREVCEQIRRRILIQNRSFELPVLWLAWGDKWLDNGWHGFLPNCIDTRIGAAYRDENFPAGLKERSLMHLGYQQATYEETMRRDGIVGELSGGRIVQVYDREIEPAQYEETISAAGKVRRKKLKDAIVEKREVREYKMNEVPATHVFNYGTDDPLCTFALHTHYQLVMEIEHTWLTYLEVETLPEYLTSLSFVQGIPFSIQKLNYMEKKDDAAYQEAWKTLREYLMDKGWSGTSCPEFEGAIEAADVKLAAEIVIDAEEPFSTKRKKLDALAADLRAQFPDNENAELLATITERNDVNALNQLVKQHFTGEPKINFGSPKQLQHLFYDVIGMQVRIVNPLTANQKDDPVLSAAMRKFRKAKKGEAVTWDAESRAALISKASTDDMAVDTAIVLDKLPEREAEVLKCYRTVQKIATRRKLFYKPYKSLGHWRDGRVHPSFKQSWAITLRYSSADPNFQQMPKRGEGVEFREIILPHCSDAVVVSIDFKGQELILMAEQSGDEALTSCFVGDNKRDVHALTAVSMAIYDWGHTTDYATFEKWRHGDDPELKLKAKTLREKGKTVNFAGQYDAQAENIANQLKVDPEIAQQFLDAKDLAFPRTVEWKDEVRAFAEENGFVTSMMGARRHLREALNSDFRGVVAKAGRQGPNFKIQGSAAEQTKMAIGRVWSSGVFWNGRYNARFYGPVHDELVFSVHRDDALEVIRIVHSCMVERYSTMKIPSVASISLGANYGQQIECGDDYDAASIRDALNKVFKKEEIAEHA